MTLQKNIFGLIVFSMIFFLGSGLGFAQTPDGETPSVETVCDTQVGAAFGLCNAYCEAMDCDYAEPQASEQACNRVFDRFMNITGEMPPCEMPVNHCPNGVWEPDLGEQCDNGFDDPTGVCTNQCTFEIIEE